MTKAMEIVEGLIAGAVPDEAILENLKQDIVKSRADAKLNQASNFSELQTYLIYGEDFIRRSTLKNDELLSLRSDELLARVRDLLNKQHEVLYYGPLAGNQVKKYIADYHRAADVLAPLEKSYPKKQLTDKSSVVLAQYDANQLYYFQYSNRGEKFDVQNYPAITLYNKYFGGSMNSICFKEMREARGLTYSASAWIGIPSVDEPSDPFAPVISPQNYKLHTSV